jgi:hypothetical protein
MPKTLELTYQKPELFSHLTDEAYRAWVARMTATREAHRRRQREEKGRKVPLRHLRHARLPWSRLRPGSACPRLTRSREVPPAAPPRTTSRAARAGSPRAPPP